jgi:hypothetical protein
LVLIVFIIATHYLQNRCIQCSIKNNEKSIDDNINNDIDYKKNMQKKNMQKKENYSNLEYHEKPFDPQDNDEISININNLNNNQQNLMQPSSIQKSPKQLNSLDRVLNPLRYPYKSDNYYDQSWYPNLQLPFQVIGGGRRNMPTLGGTEVPIFNPPVPINISNQNIAPVYINTRGPLGEPQQVGIIYKIVGKDNQYLPLFGRRKYPNGNLREYYTTVGYHNVKVPVIVKDKYVDLGTNDIVFLQGNSEPHRVTIYETDAPQFIPYM